ncbi:HNH endonuclease signature motif containing protein [Bacillus cereus]|nr:HNH endonuclease signature motif containing protein [Bacillus cereus]
MGFLDMKYYGVYYYANIVQNIIRNPINYLRNFEAIFANNGILGWVQPFRKKSNLHVFIEFVIEELFREEAFNLSKSTCIKGTNSNPTYMTPIEYAFRIHKIEYLSFMDWIKNSKRDSVYDNPFEEYYFMLFNREEEFYKLIEVLSEEVFYIIFLNRELLQEFNEFVASYLEMCVGDEDASEALVKEGLDDIMKSNFKLKRVNIPRWVERAVYFRDRGICVSCGKDLSGFLNNDNKENYDHIIPLNLYGFNDVSNIQLLCRECNSKKSGNHSLPMTRYQRWYDE